MTRRRRTPLWLGRLARNRTALAGLALFVLVCCLALAAPWLAPEGIDVQHRNRVLEGPSADFPLGTDALGRDQLSRILWGGRVSLSVGFAVVAASLLLGIVFGGLAGFAGGLADELVMRLTDLLMAFPGILLALALVAFLGPSFANVVLALCALGWVGYARLLRGQILAIRQLDYVTAARALGSTELRIFLRHVLPNCLAPLIVEASLGMAGAILAEATLSFLGLGIQPPAPSWGGMLSRGVDVLRDAPHLTLAPGFAIMSVVLALNLFGDGLRDALDPKIGAGRH